MKNCLLTILSVFFSVQTIECQQISEWRLENRTGVSAEIGLLKSWTETGPEMLWFNQELPTGFSSVTFGNSSIYITGNRDKNDVLVAMDTLGKIKWQTPYGRSWEQSYPDSRCAHTVEVIHNKKLYIRHGKVLMAYDIKDK
ncbi:MAG: hypothetical protein WA816_08615 [Bacteroidales bacterium]